MATVAALLVPAWINPARAISVPVTMARTLTLDDAIVARRTGGSVPLAFPATHIAFSWTGPESAEIRFRTSDEEIWRRAYIAHDADAGDRHFTGVISVDRPSRLEWRVLSESTAPVVNLTLDYLNTLDGRRVTREVPAEASAEALVPNIVSRAEWGADESLKRSSGGCERQFHPLKQLFVHHTAGSNFDRNPKATMRAIYHYHVVSQGWCDIGYNFVVSYDGRIFEGRWARNYEPWEVHDSESKAGKVVSGAHVDGFNSGTAGISVMGNFETARPSPATRQALAELLAWEVDRHDLGARGSHEYSNPETNVSKKLPWIAGHRDADMTSCPGDHLYSALPAIRRDVVAVMGAGKDSTSVSLTSSAERVAYGESVTISGTLADGAGLPLPERRIRTYSARGDQDWVEGPTTTTAADGTFVFTLQPRAKLRFAAIYDGDRETWGSEGETTVRVAPVVLIGAEDAMAGGDGTYVYPPGTIEVPLVGDVTPSHVGHSVKVVVSRLQPDGSFVRVGSAFAELTTGGSFSYRWPVDDPTGGGTYQAHAIFMGDGDHTWARSTPVTFVVEPGA